MKKQQSVTVNSVGADKMTGEYNIKIFPYPKEKNWRSAKMLATECILEIDGKKHIFKGLLAKE